MKSSSGGSRLRAPSSVTSDAATSPASISIRSGIPHSLPDGELSGVFRSPCASIQTTATRPCRRASSRTAPTWEQQHPPRMSGRDGSARPVASICASSVSSSIVAASGQGSTIAAASRISWPLSSPHARGTRTRPAANSRPQA